MHVISHNNHFLVAIFCYSWPSSYINSPSTIITSARELVKGTLPTNYGFDYAFTSNYDHGCGVVTIGKSSSVQILSLTADFGSGDVVRGSYRLEFGGHFTECIEFNATAANIRSALLSLRNVFDVDVVQYSTRQGSSFPLEYKIMFKGEYQYGDWPMLVIHQAIAVIDSCAEFIGGYNHAAFILPINEETPCAEGNGGIQAILLEANSPLGGTFDIHYSQEAIESIPVTIDADEMKVQYIVKMVQKSRITFLSFALTFIYHSFL